MDGVHQAVACLESHLCSFNPLEHFRDWDARKTDLLRPNGGKYPGISAEVDKSLVSSSDESETVTTSSANPIEPPAYAGEAALAAEAEALEFQRRTIPTSVPKHSVWMTLDGNKEVHKKSILRIKTDPGADFDYNKSHDRLLRVRCHSGSIGGTKSDPLLAGTTPARKPVPGNTFRLGSLYCTVVCISEKKTAFAILQCISIKSTNSEMVTWAPTDEVTLSNSSFDITGQILSLVPTASGESPHTTTVKSWIWNTKFVSLDLFTASGKIQVSSATYIRHLAVTVNGRLIIPLRQHQYVPIHIPTSWPDNAPTETNRILSWSFPLSVLEELQTALFTRLSEDGKMRALLPVFAGVREGAFPYKYHAAVLARGPPDGESFHVDCHKLHVLRTHNLSSEISGWQAIEYSTENILPPPPPYSCQPCAICHRSVAGCDRYNHVGGHITRALKGVFDAKLDESVDPQKPRGVVRLDAFLQAIHLLIFLQVSLMYPCGFCGGSMVNGKCTVTIESGLAKSLCPLAYSFRVWSAATSGVKNPCTNIPIQCTLCTSRVGKSALHHWKINMPRHLRERHGAWYTDAEHTAAEGDVRAALLVRIEITDEEMERLGIPEAKRGKWAYSIDLYDARRATELHGDPGASPRRNRSAYRDSMSSRDDSAPPKLSYTQQM